MLVDVNLLLFATDTNDPRHERAIEWWQDALSGPSRVALCWQTIGAFVRLTTNPRTVSRPLRPEQSWSIVQSWLDQPTVWIPQAGPKTAEIFGILVTQSHVTANGVPDAQLAALAIENGLAVYSHDTDFARWPECRWVNPIA